MDNQMYLAVMLSKHMQIVYAFKNRLFWNTKVCDHDFTTTELLKILTGDIGTFALIHVMKSWVNLVTVNGVRNFQQIYIGQFKI